MEMEGTIRRRHADQLRKSHFVPSMETDVDSVNDICEYLPSNFDKCSPACLSALRESTDSAVGQLVVAVPTSQSELPSEDEVVNVDVSVPDDRVPFLDVSQRPSPRSSTRVPKPLLRFYEQFDM